MTCRCAGWTAEMLDDALTRWMFAATWRMPDAERIPTLAALFPPLEPETRTEGNPEGGSTQEGSGLSIAALCPWCGGQTVQKRIDTPMEDEEWFSVTCEDCEAAGPVRHYGEAVSEWNRVAARATPGQPEENSWLLDLAKRTHPPSVASPEEREAPAGEPLPRPKWRNKRTGELRTESMLKAPMSEMRDWEMLVVQPWASEDAPSPVVSGAGEQGERDYRCAEERDPWGSAISRIQTMGHELDQPERTQNVIDLLNTAVSRLRATVERTVEERDEWRRMDEHHQGKLAEISSEVASLRAETQRLREDRTIAIADAAEFAGDLKDAAERMRWLEDHGRYVGGGHGGRWTIVFDTPLDSECFIDQLDAARVSPTREKGTEG